MLKDLGLAVDAAQQVDRTVVLGSMVRKLYQQLCQEGDAHLDFSASCINTLRHLLKT